MASRAATTISATVAPKACTTGMPLKARTPKDPPVVRADRRRLAQALSNLVANAVEHGSGPVELSGTRVGSSVVVEVRDDGPAPGAPRPGSSRAGDRGRGLAIASRAAEEAGGRLAIHRRPDGTTAAIELPVAEP